MMALVTLLGGWRATVFAVIALVAGLWGAVGWSTVKADRAAAELKFASAARQSQAVTDSWRQSVYDIAYTGYQRDRTYAEHTAALSADLADGERRLRARFRCPVPHAPAGPTVRPGDPAGGREQPGGLQESDLRVADRIGRDADAVAVAYADCRATLVTLGIVQK